MDTKIKAWEFKCVRDVILDDDEIAFLAGELYIFEIADEFIDDICTEDLFENEDVLYVTEHDELGKMHYMEIRDLEENFEVVKILYESE